MATTIGFVGLGIMGKPMAKNLINAGFTLRVFDLNQDRCKSVATKYDIKPYKTLGELLKKTEALSVVTPTKDHKKGAEESENNFEINPADCKYFL